MKQSIYKRWSEQSISRCISRDSAFHKKLTVMAGEIDLAGDMPIKDGLIGILGMTFWLKLLSKEVLKPFEIYLSGSLMSSDWKLYKTRKGKAGGVGVVAIHLPTEHSPRREAGFLLSEGRFRKPEQLPEFRNFQLSVGGPDSGTFRLRYRALDRPITTVQPAGPQTR